MTQKALFTLLDGVTIETVLMGYHDRSTVCVSTQAGCAMGCTFCATGSLGLQRNLTTGEMIQQVVWAAQTIKAHNAANPAHPLSPSLNVVFMGMGEPFANYEQWWQAVERLHDPKGMNMGARKMTVSTVGVVPGIERLTYEALPINLAISLHAPNDEMRTQLVPLNQRYPIAAILEAAQAYTSHTGRRVSFEYVLIQGYNDQPAHAEELARTLRSMAVAKQTLLFHINLIPWNPIPGQTLHRSHQQQALAFQEIVTRHHIACSIRVERGTEIAAACGQLAGGGGGEMTYL
jgi:23S rRNA (adenine2503-C2)-methyltransferase